MIDRLLTFVQEALEETTNEILQSLGLPVQEVPGEYHPTGAVIEGTAVPVIEDETRLLGAETDVSEQR